MNVPGHPASPLLDHCPEGLPAAMYRDAAWHERERRAIWARNWIYAGRLNDLPPGRMRRVEVAGQPLILCRDAQGRVTAFHNTCRHRGAELCAEAERPLGRLITCPYHGWSYATDGRLVSTAFGTPTAAFRKCDHGLYPAQVTEWNGFLFLNLSDDAAPLAPDAGLDAFDRWPMPDLATGHRIERDLACNWKVFWENYNECLHCPGIHPELCDLVPVYRQGIMSPREAGDPAAAGAVLRDGAATWTTTGRPCGPEFPGLSPEQRANGANFVTIYPTMYVVAHIDYVRAVSLAPTGPETVRLTAEWLFAPDTLAQPGFNAAEVAAFATLVIDQDGAAAEMNQRGLRSDRFESARLMPQEFDIHRFHQWILGQMEQAP